MLIADKLPELVKTQVEAIKNIKFDKVVVWENGGNGDKGGNTANFLANMYKAVPPMTELFNMAGLELPSYLGEKMKTEENPENKEDKGKQVKE
jgi:flotillin